MKYKPFAVLAIGVLLATCVSGAFATGLDTDLVSRVPSPYSGAATPADLRGARLETLWIFDADFEDLSGDNAGWQSFDRSGTLGQDNYWHHDTIRLSEAYLGESTWWCGTNNICWPQPRGYGNNWLQILEREFPEIEANTNIGDDLFLEYDQRFAMEHDYDYGYTEVSIDGGSTWITLETANNPGFAGKPGLSKDWDDAETGHVEVDLTAYAGTTIGIRFRMESDGAYSSEDEYDNGAPNHSVQDGAWQIDNIELIGPSGQFWLDDSESGNLGWVHEPLDASGQTNVTFERGQFGMEFLTGQDFTCDDRPIGSWMYAAVDPVTSTMVDNEYAWLMSPPINISGAPKLVGQWDMWVELPRPSDDIFNLYLASNDLIDCVVDPSGFIDEETGWWYGGPFWSVWSDDWDAFAGNEWLAILWAEQHSPPADGTPSPGPHAAGIFLNRQRVGIPSGDAGTAWEIDDWNFYHDWFIDDLNDALLDSARIKVKDDDDILSVTMMASNDGGLTWSSYDCHKENPQGDWYVGPPPSVEMTPGSVIRYGFEAVDGVGNVAVLPSRFPDLSYEMSILPILGSEVNPAMLLVDKHGRRMPGEDRTYRHSSEYYYREPLEILGYEYDKYDVEVPSGSTEQSAGPDSAGMRYYHTQIWFTNEFDSYTIKPPDQANLIEWLNQSGPGVERNLLLTGNDIGKELMGIADKETLQFYETWMASDWIENAVGAVTVDSVPGLEDKAGGWDFMTYDDGACIVRGGCPVLNYFDVVEPFPGIPGNETVADYVRVDAARRSAGVAYTNATSGYQTVNLGFGMEFMMDSMQTSRTQGYYTTGVWDRVDLMRNIMDYFAVVPTGDPTGVVDGGVRNTLSQAYPNPFNPVTKIAYSVRDAGRVSIRVFNVAGRAVRTLLDEEMAAGTNGHVVWDGRNDGGERCSSGVYFYRIEAPGFASSKKMIMMK